MWAYDSDCDTLPDFNRYIEDREMQFVLVIMYDLSKIYSSKDFSVWKEMALTVHMNKLTPI
jgi:hypothetical protein